MAQYMLRHPLKALSKNLYIKWVYKGNGRKFFVTKQINSAISILKEASYFNIVGEKIIKKAIECALLPKEGVRFINGVPMALKMMF